MNEIKNFEDLKVWQIGRRLVQAVYGVTKKGGFRADFRLAGQIQAAAVSITSNIAEGFERGSAAEFHKFLVVAKSSCAEVRSQLYNAKDIGYISEVEFQLLMELAALTARMVGALRESVKLRIQR